MLKDKIKQRERGSLPNIFYDVSNTLILKPDKDIRKRRKRGRDARREGRKANNLDGYG